MFTNKPLIVAPYPSYAHFLSPPNQASHSRHVAHQLRRKRDVNMFFASGPRFRSHHNFRSTLLKQLPAFTSSTFEGFIRNRQVAGDTVDAVVLATPECVGSHHRHTIDWMLHSRFCLQPSGDSPTRKSFYDSVMSGCVPVTFHADDDVTQRHHDVIRTRKHHVRYPFERWLNYSRFTVRLRESDVTRGVDVRRLLEPYSDDVTLTKLRHFLLSSAQYLQYSIDRNDNDVIKHDDAMRLIFAELQLFVERRENERKRKRK